MVKFNINSVALLQQKVFNHTGQKIIVRDNELLESAITSPFQTFGECELYPTVEEKGARLGYNIISSHPFVDGNKRMGILTMLCFLEINNINLYYSSNDIINIGLSLASGTMSYKQLVCWVNSHKITKDLILKENENFK